MINFFKKEGVLVEVDGNPTPEEVREEIRRLI
jgi:adenylate kinase family enzyme